jgi:uncharacterized protein YbjT (DUF2867 family)
MSAELERRGHKVLRSSRSARPGWLQLDFLAANPGNGVPADLDAIVHCAASGNPSKTIKVEGDGMVALRRAAPRARIVYPSIVGCDQIRASFFRAKATSEEALKRAGGNHAILRLTQFHEFADRLARLPIPMVFAGMRTQPVAAVEAGKALADVAEGCGQGLVGEMGGPEVHRLVDLVRARIKADGRHRPILHVPVGTRDLRAGRNLPDPSSPKGRITWAQHMKAA